MHTLRFVIVLPLLLLGSPTLASGVEDWRSDIDAMVRELETVHPNAFGKIEHSVFRAQADALKEEIPNLTEEQRMVRAMQLVALIGDGHTQLSPNRRDFALWYPVRLYEFTDGYFVTAAYKTDADLVGAQILTIDGKPVQQVMDNVRTLMNNETAFDREEHLFAFHNAMLMKGLKYAAGDGSLKITARLKGGRVVERLLQAHRSNDPRYRENDSTLDWRFLSEVYGPPFGDLRDWTTAYKHLPTAAYRTVDTNRPAHLAFRRPFVAFAIPERNAYFVQVNSVGNWGDKRFEQFFRDALAEVDIQKPASLIIDLRYNAGGDGSKVPGMIHQFIKREDDPPWKHLYILTGRKTFSAAIMVLAAFIDHTRVSIIGEPAGAPLDAYGDPTTIALPRVGMELDISTLWHQLEDSGARYAIMPVDVPAPFSFADYETGRDPAVDAILRGDEMRSIPIIALEDGGAAARKVFDERQKRFAKYAQWMKPREVDLLHAVWKMGDGGRTDDALEVAKIMTELYPDSALSAGKLGEALIAAGQKDAGLKSYKRALSLDPNNLDNIDERNALSEGTFAKPDSIRFGATVEQMKTILGNLCKTVNARRITPPFLDKLKDRQMQIDCEGLPFQGKPRHAEFVFGDDSLKMVWIMTGPEERIALEAAMTNAYGQPQYRNDKYVGFASARAAIRLDRAELLFYAEDAEEDVLPDISR
jgi:tetratricopeptide (TPR) repeat protein